MSWLSTALREMTLSVDLGNMAVGVGTAAIALVTLYISAQSSGESKRRMISGFRKEWVEDLRKSCAEYAATATKLRLLSNLVKFFENNGDQDRATEHTFEYKGTIDRFDHLHQYILLLLNPNELEHKKLIDYMEETRNALLGSDSEIPLTLDQFTDLVRTVLKSEWDRVKVEL